jgi:hypothetical protein
MHQYPHCNDLYLTIEYINQGPLWPFLYGDPGTMSLLLLAILLHHPILFFFQ